MKKINLTFITLCGVLFLGDSSFTAIAERAQNPEHNLSQEFSQHLRECRELQQQKHWEAAKKECTGALKLKPNHPAALSELGLLAYQLKDWTLARQATSQAIQYADDPKLRSASLYNFARLQEAVGEKQAAILSYQSILLTQNNSSIQERLKKWGIANQNTRFVPEFLQGPFADEDTFWKQRKKACKQELTENNPQESGERWKAEFLIDDEIPTGKDEKDFSTAFSDDSITMHSEICGIVYPSDGKDTQRERRTTFHIFWETPTGLYVYPAMADVFRRERDGDDLTVSQFLKKNFIDPKIPSLMVRFTVSELHRHGNNSDESIDTEYLFLLGIGPSGRPSGISPMPLRVIEEISKEVENEEGPLETRRKATIKEHFFSGGILELRMPSKHQELFPIGDISALPGRHRIRFL